MFMWQSSTASISKNKNSLNGQFSVRSPFYDPISILNIAPCQIYYLTVYKKCTFESFFMTYSYFCEFSVTIKNFDWGEILPFGDVYPKCFYYSRVLLTHANVWSLAFEMSRRLMDRAWTIMFWQMSRWCYCSALSPLRKTRWW